MQKKKNPQGGHKGAELAPKLPLFFMIFFLNCAALWSAKSSQDGSIYEAYLEVPIIA